MKSYIKLFFDWEESAEALTDAEKLNLIRVMIAYASGKEYEFIGNERFVFPAFKTQLDRANGIYETKCRISRENGSKSNGRPRKPIETEKTDIGFSEPEKPTDTQEKDKEERIKTKTEEKDEDIRQKTKDNNIKKEENPYGVADIVRPRFDTLEAYASTNIRNLSADSMDELISYRDTLPDDVIRHAINIGCDNDVPKYSYVKAILNGYVENGVKSLADAKAADAKFKQQKGGGKQTSNNNYQQREYKAEDFNQRFYYDPMKDYPAEG